MIINERVEKEYFDRIAAGDKRDLRLANRAVHEGDTLILEEWDHDTREYTGRKVETVVTAVHPMPAATDWAAEGEAGEGLRVIEFTPKESKFTRAS
jgi:tRNA(Glu) U13 pseudouridine synthase TruD